MAGVRLVAKGVEDEDVEVLQERDAVRWDVAHVGEVGGGAEAVADDGVAAVGDGDDDEFCAEEVDGGAGRGVDAIDDDARGGWGKRSILRKVYSKTRSMIFCGGVVGVEREAVGLAEGEGAEVVHAEDVVGVAVGVEDGVDAVDVFADGLGVEVGAGVDQDGVVVIVDAEGGAGAAVFGAGLVGVDADVASRSLAWGLPWMCRCRGM